jgi:hypothetical protein
MTRGGKNQTSVLCLRRIFREKSVIIWIEGYGRSIPEAKSALDKSISVDKEISR